MALDLDRARGVLWGQAIGDAVGTTQEFLTPSDRLAFPGSMQNRKTTSGVADRLRSSRGR